MHVCRSAALRLGLFALLGLTWDAQWGGAASTGEHAARPNILWITSEDNAAYWLGCYGNTEADTPRLDALAEKSILFTRAYSNAPVCAVARSTILHGVYAVSSGTQHMRSRHRIPDTLKPYVTYLREQGYYCTNAQKTDYNRLGDDQGIWDACHRGAHYKQRAPGQPFFAIFNLTVSHESSLFPRKVAANRKSGLIPTSTRLSPKQVTLPPYLPDLPEVREDIAIYHDNLTALDSQVGRLLDELDQRGLADDTIVFYYADHGGATPRGKRYLTDTGVRVPMIVHFPEKWQHLAPFPSGKSTDELVGFVDLAPTLLSLTGLDKPAQMQGRAFLGDRRIEPPQDDQIFLYADRFDEIYGMRRGLTDGRFKYIRRFTPYLPAAPCSHYSLSQPAWAAWQQAWAAGKLQQRYRQLWETPQPIEELYDLRQDPWEVQNLAEQPEHAQRLQQFRRSLQQEMIRIRDTGGIPEPMFRSLAAESTIMEYTRSEAYDIDRIIRSAFVASSGKSTNLGALSEMLTDESPVVRYWGALGCIVHGEQAASLRPKLEKLLTDAQPCNRMTAAQALDQLGPPEVGQAAVLKELDSTLNAEESILLTNLLKQLGCEPQVPMAWIRENRGQQTNEYVRRFADRLHQQRSQ